LTIHISSVRGGGLRPAKADYIDAFRVGAGIYVGTFFLGNNWDYRQMFLLLVIPQLIAWTREKDLRVLSIITLSIMLFVCWSNMFTGNALIVWLEELFEWVIFSNLFYLLLRTMPPWIQEEVFNFTLKECFARRRRELSQSLPSKDGGAG
jgi:hypothetical protein